MPNERGREDSVKAISDIMETPYFQKRSKCFRINFESMDHT
jgi:hypothetical protein